MYRFLLRPKWIGFTLLVVLLVVVMVNLAFWQLRRLHERREFNSTVRSRSEQPTEAVPTLLTPSTDPATVEWRPAGISGTYLAGETVTVVNRSQDGEAGRDVVTPLLLDDGSVLLVNRGFVPGTKDAPGPPPGRVEVTGLLRRSDVRGTGQTADASGVVLTEIRRIDIPKLAPQLGPPVQPMYLDLVDSDPREEHVEPVAMPELSEGPHLSYTVQWFIFSACAVAGWVIVVRRAAHPDRPRKPGGPPPILESER